MDFVNITQPSRCKTMEHDKPGFGISETRLLLPTSNPRDTASRARAGAHPGSAGPHRPDGRRRAGREEGARKEGTGG